ncbi:ATP-dependent DNA helicase SRS2 isoform X1 [Acetobacter orientalis]|uniref:ATP-dependent DNA helicase SRS2 isoform X1 n=1 Tax=Acetobacter orientalis TaxID=146474 RepID=A0A2Z5ZI14_9PROT|nr:ATP-dependent DNA helicase SRS2 isoform X1 [Acetobacter orientalis]
MRHDGLDAPALSAMQYRNAQKCRIERKTSLDVEQNFPF